MTLLHSEDGTLSSQQVLGYEENGTSYRKASGFQESELLPLEDTDVQRPQQRHAFHNRQTSRNTDRTDGLDEVGFGAHIDKSVAAAGDHVSLDMFVVKSDLMKVVDIKVSLVETIQVFSLMDHDDACSVISPRASRARVFGIPGDQNEHTDQEYTSSSRRRLVDTYVCKIAKDYVPAQSEESHANGNHLKGYYEDYEDFRTAKSLSVYKIGMRIPETALTVSDRELLQVDYMFVIKFFFKGRMGAFLELPIEIVSQYNHNRISTISGAISCVSNSVQIALPPVPILVRRTESFLTDSNTTESSNTLQSKAVDPEAESCRDGRIDGIDSSCRTDSFIIQNCDEAISAARGSRTSLQKLVDSGTTANEPVMAPTGKETPLPRLSVSVASAKANIVQDSSTTVAKKTLPTTDGPSSDRVKHATSLDTGKKAPLHSWGTGSNSPKSAIEYKSSSAVAGRKEGQDIVSRSGLSKAESEACKSNVARITAALMGKELAATASSKNSVGLKKSSTLNSAVSSNGVPKIIVNSGRSKRGTTNSTSSNSTFNTFKSNSTLTSNSTRRSSLQDKDLSSPDDQAASVIKPAPFPNSKVSVSSVTSAGTSEVASPTLPLLFDLTSAALPSSPTVNVPAPIAIPVRVSTSGNSSGNTNSVGNNGQGIGTLTSAVTSPSSAVNGFKDTGASLQQQQLLYARRNRASSIQSTSASSNFSGSTDDSSSLDSSNDSRSTHNNNGLVAKIAKSLSSPLLRSRAGSASGGLTAMTSPNSSSTNLHSVSPQQQSTAFTLAATTLSALTLLSSVGQAAVASEGATCNRNMGAVGMAHSGTSNGSSQHQQYGRRLYQSSPSALQPLTSCLKKRRESAPAITVTTSLSTGLNGARKKVTFAKGTTPLSSPTASQVFFPETEYCPKTGQPYHHQFQQRQQFSSYGSSSPTPAFYSQQQGLLTPKGFNVAFTRAAAAALPAIGTSVITRTATQMVRSPKDTLPISATTVGAIMNGTQIADAELMMGGKSPSSATPRSRMYHPFDSHPSRLSPLEKQHLGFQIKTQSPMSASHTGLDSDQEQGRSARRGTDVEDEDDEEDDEDDDEDIEYEDEDDSEDDDERETDEQRIERRRQARAAWLAKYGDAFKQVYGAVPELPPI
ncbi:hypothetical protein BGZ99_010329 [Dissophora globulifera]|uniref:Uncharacterized protein n=1 Tax=Dissophora globulifera TaxID=979702 RepID=A0A9P6R2L0_9FUNG|nr:hypothetical protein BGZ99_010329 [Dissophora globulifera]